MHLVLPWTFSFSCLVFIEGAPGITACADTLWLCQMHQSVTACVNCLAAAAVMPSLPAWWCGTPILSSARFLCEPWEFVRTDLQGPALRGHLLHSYAHSLGRPSLRGSELWPHPSFCECEPLVWRECCPLTLSLDFSHVYYMTVVRVT